MIIFGGHFPDGTAASTEREVEGETRGGWCVRQLRGSANISGGHLLHLLSGNLSHQIEHHLFSHLPAHRYAEIAALVRASCERHGLPYSSRGLVRQFGGVVRGIVTLSLPLPARLPPAAI
jgi:linoleoyl-CoA desaturase